MDVFLMLSTYDKNFEKKLIKSDAQEVYQARIYIADSRQLETDFMFNEFLKWLRQLATKKWSKQKSNSLQISLGCISLHYLVT